MKPADGFEKPLARQIAWFALVGTLGFATDLAAYFLFAGPLGLPPLQARLAAFLPATLVTWALNRAISFSRGGASTRGAGRQYLRYLAVQGAGIAVSFAVFTVTMRQWPSMPVVGLVLGSGAAMVLNFAGSRLLVFSGPRGHD